MLDKLLNIIEPHYNINQYPTLHHQAKEWSKSKILQGVKILDSTPIFRNTCAKYISLICAGADLTVAHSNVMPYDPAIVLLLRTFGIKILDKATASNQQYDIILDCAGAFSQFEAQIGYVELTRSGVESYQNCKKPVFVADSGKIKQIETCLGTGESFFRAMKSLGHTDFKGKNLVIFGSGKVGRGIIAYSKQSQAHTTVITKIETITEHISNTADNIIDINNQPEITKAITSADIIVTATGVRNAVESVVNSSTLSNSNAIFVNMGVEDEWGATIPNERVLNNKQPLNFILDEPTNMQYIETTMALHNYGAQYLLEHPTQRGIINPPISIETALLDIVSHSGIINTELSELLGDYR